MAAPVMMMAFYQAKSKYRWSSVSKLKGTSVLMYFAFIMCFLAVVDCAYKDCGTSRCYNGVCTNETTGTCECEHGWIGQSCHRCGGRIRLNGTEGYITDGMGNYTLNTKCSWLLEGPVNATVHLQLEHFATECSWDHLYVYDGNSIFAPRMLAAFSGLVVTGPPTNQSLPRVTAHSGSIYLHFFSDAAYNMSGFNISYRIQGCPTNCSGRGWCRPYDQKCICEEGYTGDACHIILCPNNCGQHGSCQSTYRGNHHCECRSGYRDSGCQVPDQLGVWEHLVPHPNDSVPVGRASHKGVVYKDHLWVVSGYNFHGEPFENVVRYNYLSQRWETVNVRSTSPPKRRYGHSLVLYQDSLYMFGGLEHITITDELWRLDLSKVSWHLVTVRTADPGHEVMAVVGHTAHVIDGIMYVVFGHSPVFGYMNTVQEYNISTSTWSVPKTHGAIVKGGYGHSSVYDETRNLMYIHAGYLSGSLSNYHLSDSLYSYDPHKRYWRILRSSGQFKYLHSAVIISDLMLVFGGNTHNDTSKSQGAKCYSSDFLAYDIECDRWYPLDTPKLDQPIPRFGHISVVYNDDMYVFGGFNGLMLNDMFRYQPGNCKSYRTELDCLAARPGVKCVWSGAQGCLLRKAAEKLKGLKIISSYNPPPADCPPFTDDSNAKCQTFSTCPSCVETSYSCQWCENRCSGTACENREASTLGECVDEKYKSECNQLHNCHACEKESHCRWEQTDKTCSFDKENMACKKGNICPEKVRVGAECSAIVSSNCRYQHNCAACHRWEHCGWDTESKECAPFFKHSPEGFKVSRLTELSNEGRYRTKCEPSCQVHTTCENCTKAACMWCSNQQRCVESNSYVASFPYGQCMEWTTQNLKCPATYCSELSTCEVCQAHPACGWCDDSSKTGLGTCMMGGASGPIDLNGTTPIARSDRCPAPRWFFVGCPLCQCNGHSTCKENTSECLECKNLTKGSQCELCKEGFFGDPINGGNCTACECNGQADICDGKTGKCHCRTRGMIGDHCDQCDETHKYFGNPRGGGTCNYDLTTDYQFTFNLSKEDDKYYTQINFMNMPEKPDRDVDFNINCSGRALMNITVKTEDPPYEKAILENRPCKYFKMKLYHKDYVFGRDSNTTFYVSLYDFKTPFWLQISFSQFPQIDLVHFFVTFFSCFLSLLLVAAVFWKVRQRFARYRDRQRMVVQLEQMAARPFSSCTIDVTPLNSAVSTKKEPPDPRGSRRKKLHSNKLNKPSPIAMEPLYGHRAALLALIVRLPTGDEDYTPPGQSGIAIASALVTLGNPRKASVEHSKTDKNKARKVAAQTMENCI